MKLYKIHFEPFNRGGDCPANQSLLQVAQDLEIDLVSLCGGLGTCHRCKLQVLTGLVSPLTENEKSTLLPQEIKDGYRLACQTYPLGDCNGHRLRVWKLLLTWIRRFIPMKSICHLRPYQTCELTPSGL